MMEAVFTSTTLIPGAVIAAGGPLAGKAAMAGVFLLVLVWLLVLPKSLLGQRPACEFLGGATCDSGPALSPSHRLPSISGGARWCARFRRDKRCDQLAGSSLPSAAYDDGERRHTTMRLDLIRDAVKTTSGMELPHTATASARILMPHEAGRQIFIHRCKPWRHHRSESVAR